MSKFKVGDRLIDREFNDKRCVVVNVLPEERVVVHYDSDPVGVIGDWPISDFELVDDSVPAVSETVRFAPGDFAVLDGMFFAKVIHFEERLGRVWLEVPEGDCLVDADRLVKAA